MAWAWIIYLIGSYASLAFLLFSDQVNDEAWAKTKQGLVGVSLWRKTLLAVVLSLVFLLLGPLVPLFLVYCLWAAKRDVRFWKGFAKQHRDVIMDPIAFNTMNAAGRSFVMQHEQAIDELSFRAHSNYLYKPAPLLIECRCYLSADGRTILSIGHIDGDEYYSLSSFLSGGAGVETGVSHHPSDVDDINATGRYYARLFDLNTAADVAAIYAAHESMLDELSRDTGQEIVVMRHDQLVPAMRYANRRFAETKHSLGGLNAAPPAAEWPFEDQNEDMVAV